MSILKKRNILKLAATFMLVGMMAGTFVMHSSVVFAATTAACNIATFIQGNCDMSVTATSTGDVTFSNDAAVALTGPVASGANAFTFNTIVQDQRTGTAGWSLTATSSGGLQVGGLGLSLPLLIGGTATPATVCTATPTCPTVSSPLTTLTTLTGTAQPFASAATTASPHGGLVTVTTPGSFTLPPTAPPGNYTGTITISLVTAP